MDDREPPKMFSIAENVGGIEFHKKRLKTGDYICGDVIIERKTIDDFCTSIIDNRLTNQITKMKAQFTHIYILVSGTIDQRTSTIHENCILGKMASIIVKHKVPLLFVENDFQLVYLMKRLFERHLDEKKG